MLNYPQVYALIRNPPYKTAAELEFTPRADGWGSDFLLILTGVDSVHPARLETR